MRPRNELALLPKSPLLITESADEFDALRDAFEQEIKPRGIIEQMYVHDICSIVWEILRLRRCKVVIINSAFRGALQNLFKQLLKQPGQYDYEVEDEAQALAQAWFTDKEAKKQVFEILSRFQLDETAIEAEAIRKSSADLELLQDADLAGVTSRQGAWLRCRISRQPSAPAAPERGPHHRWQGCSSARRCIQQEANGGLTMASERQIAANRRNARKSTGPRSRAGRKRASGNAYRHGLTLSISSTAGFAKQLNKLVRKIVGDTKDEIVLERARAVAQAELELARVRRAKVALIERAAAFGELDPPQLTSTRIIRLLNDFLRGRETKPVDGSAAMPSQEPERSAEAVRRVLPELRKLDRYERRAATQRDRGPRSF